MSSRALGLCIQERFHGFLTGLLAVKSALGIETVVTQELSRAEVVSCFCEPIVMNRHTNSFDYDNVGWYCNRF